MNINSANNNQNSSYTNAAYSSKGFSGMASGIDTESLVQTMLSGIQNKIDKQTQKQTILEYKQEAYRDVIKKINDFQDKYLNLTSKDCIRLASLYNTMKSESSSSAVSVTPGANAVDGSFDVQVARLATKTSVTSGKASSGGIKVPSENMAKTEAFKYDRSVQITIGKDAQARTFDLDFEGVRTIDDAYKKINDATGPGFVSVKETFKTSNGKALTQKLYKSDGTEYTGNVTRESVYKGVDENKNKINLTLRDGKYYISGTNNEYDGKINIDSVYKDADGNVLNAKYFEEGKTDAYTGDVNTTRSLAFKNLKEFEISGSSAGMAIIGLSGKKVTSSNDEGINEIKPNEFNENFAKIGGVNGTVDFTLDGVKKSFTIKEGESMAKLEEQVQKAFGKSVKYDSTNGEWTVDGEGRQLTVSANSDTMEAIGFAKGTTKLSSQILRTDTMEKLGINFPAGTEENPGTNTFKINGTEISYTAKDTISSIMNKINSSDAGVTMSYDELSGKFSISSKSEGSGFDINLDSDNAGLFNALGFAKTAAGGFDGVKAGQNAIVNINGATVERASNSFTYNGMSITVKSVTGDYAKDPDGKLLTNEDGTLKLNSGFDNKATISTSRNVDKIVDTLKSFVDDYNTLIEDLNKQIHADANYKKYPPLTEAQKKEMSEKEIELWEEKSKEGILRGDRDISTFLSDMRAAMYTKGDSKYVLSNIGINSSSQWSDFGKLSIDEDTLRKALTTDAAEVAKLFTGENGLATRLNDIAKKCANTSSGSPGALVQIAGVKGKGTEKSNQIYDQLNSIKARLEKLNMTYESRKERYWKTFNAMEKALQSMNSQNDQLNSFFYM